MDRHLKNFVEEFLDIDEISDYQYKEVCGFTFVFKREITVLNDRISSADIRPIAIIYEENGQYYLAPIDVVDEIEEVVKGFVSEQLQ